MSNKSNVFDYYEQIRKQQIHYDKISNPEVLVPGHLAYKPIKNNIQQTRINERLRKQVTIQRQNMHIMKKLFQINNRKPKLSLSNSTPVFSLPPIILKRKPFVLPEHQNQNNFIAEKLIKSKSSINVKSQLKEYHQKQRIRKNISKYHSLKYNDKEQGLVDRKKYLAELMMLKKLRISEQVQSRVKSILINNSRVSKLTKEYNSGR